MSACRDFDINPYKCDSGTKNSSLYVAVHEDVTSHHKTVNLMVILKRL